VLACFGGAGGLHVCALADAMQMRRAIVPVHCGVLSALGMIVAARGRQFSKTVGIAGSDINVVELSDRFEQLAEVAQTELAQEGLSRNELQIGYSIDMRYRGQSYTLNIPWSSVAETIKKFHLAHEQRYGYALDEETELVNIRVQVTAEPVALALPEFQQERRNNPAQNVVYEKTGEATVYPRATLNSGAVIMGPAVITEYAATTYVAAGWEAEVDERGNLLLTKVISL